MAIFNTISTFKPSPSFDIWWPSMTSNTEPFPIVASASSEKSGNPAWYAFASFESKPLKASWVSQGGSDDEWVEIDLGEETVVNSLAIAGGIDSNNIVSPPWIYVKGSLNGSDWDLFYEDSDIVWDNGSGNPSTLNISLSPPKTARYLRIGADNLVSKWNSEPIGFYDIAIGRPKFSTTQFFLWSPMMKSNNLPSSFIATSSSNESDSKLPYQAFAGNSQDSTARSTAGWVSAKTNTVSNQWVQIDFGKRVHVKKAYIRPYFNGYGIRLSPDRINIMMGDKGAIYATHPISGSITWPANRTEYLELDTSGFKDSIMKIGVDGLSPNEQIGYNDIKFLVEFGYYVE